MPTYFQLQRRCRSIQPAILLLLALGAFLISPRPAAAQLDNNVQWNGVSHTAWIDRSPRCPRNGESFTVRFQTYHTDVASAKVRIDTGTVTEVNASIAYTRGPYDVWTATVPATPATAESYVIELTDGSITDYLSASGMSHTLDTSNPFALDFTTLSHAPIGATPVPGGTVFKVWSPSTTSCQLRGIFNAWGTTPMNRVGEYWIVFMPGAVAGNPYRYYFNNLTWNSDPRCAALNPGDNYNSIITDQDAYTWVSAPFSPKPIEQLVFYELHVGTFSGLNDPVGTAPTPSRYADVTARVSHLVDLGVNAVWINPINEFPGDISAGYNPITPWAIESKLGTPADFKQMVDTLHQNNIAVLLDVVWNHVSPTDNFLWNFDGSQIYFDSPTYQNTPYGAQADIDKSSVFNYYLDSAESMMTDYRIDAFRFDAVMYLTDSTLTGQWASGQALMQAMNNLRANRHVDKHSIAEIFIDNPWVTNAAPAGLGFTAQYQNAFKNNLRAAIFAASSNSANVTSVANILGGQGFGVSGSSVLNYFELHDECWPSSGGQRAVKTIDTTAPYDDQYARGRTMIAETLVMLSRGVPGIIMGTEWLESNDWLNLKIDWSKKTTYAGIFKYYKALVHLRTSAPELFANSPINVYHVNETADVFAFERYLIGGGSYITVVNLSNTDQNSYRIGLTRSGPWSVLLNSNATQFGGPGGGSAGALAIDTIPYDSLSQSVNLKLPAHSVLILKNSLPACLADFNGSGTKTVQDLFDFLAAWFNRLSSADVNLSGTITVQDLFDFLAAWFTGCPA